MTGSIAADARRRAFTALSDSSLDVLVIGGGIVGCGALLDATSRGLTAALVERDDLAVGTSSRSSRLIHGGLRYLEQYRFGLVREALAERHRILKLAPHLVRIQPFLFPLIGQRVITRSFFQAGMTLYDVLGARRDGGWNRHRSVKATLSHAPALRRKRLRGGLVFHDAVHDDARYVLSVARTAELGGGVVATRAIVERLIEENGRVTGARVRDTLGGGSMVVRARTVVDATGAWAADSASPLSGGSTSILPSRGSHLVVRRARIPSDVGLTIRVPGKVVFLVPWPHHWLIGTTDAPYEGPIDRPNASSDEVTELLDAVNRVMDVDLRRDDLVGTYSGVRPLIAPSGGTTIAASREHRVVAEANGLIRVSGGKFTTYRLMARDAIDAAVRGLGEDPRTRKSGTADLHLVGAAEPPELEQIAAAIASDHRLARDVADRLVRRHGRHAAEIAALGAKENLLATIGPGIDHLEVEVAWAARHEHALSVDDVLSRRMRLAQELPDRGAAIAGRVAAILGAELGWDEERRSRSAFEFLEGARREYGVPA
ncbi:MAG TPA: glycerol-3-phosphate dehydrogenase/oxidase [Candidatus Limnocylindrales bacterium]|nr:glycerol-3-phosphate dehydrogenase/oxidase [Candidatus Limnocylindrales bacterium]